LAVANAKDAVGPKEIFSAYQKASAEGRAAYDKTGDPRSLIAEDKMTAESAKGVTEKGSLPVNVDKRGNWVVKLSDGSERRYDAKTDGKVMSPTLSQTAVYNTVINQEKQKQSELTPDAIKLAGSQYAITGVMPSMGMGNARARAQIINSAAEYWRNQGIDPSKVPQIQADFKATKDTLIAQKKAVEPFKAFEGAMIKNAEYALSLSSKYERSNYPPANSVINAIKTGTGDPQVVEFSNALYAASLEYQKIKTAGTAITSAELSITAQQKAEELMNKAHNHKQLEAAMRAMRTDGRNVVAEREKMVQGLSDDLAKVETQFGFNKGNATPAPSGGSRFTIKKVE
jgi:hypothetical protein